MKLCMVMAGAEEGGLEKHFVDLCNALANNREINILAIGHEKYASRFSELVCYKVIDLSRSRNNIAMLYSLCETIRHFNPDIIHAQANKAAAMIKRLRKLLPGKKIATLHSLKKKTNMFKAYDHVVAVSSAAQTRLPEGIKSSVIYNGMSIDEPPKAYSRIELCQQAGFSAPEKTLCLAVGRLVHPKAFDLLLEAWVDIDANLLLVGDGADKSTLMQLHKKFSLHNKVSFMGHRKDVLSLLKSVDVCVISSRYEGFPYILVESLMMKTPLISTAVPGCSEVLPEERLMEPNSVEALSEGLKKQLGNIESLKEDFKPLYNYAEEHLSLAAMAKQYENLYQSLL